VSGGPNFAYDLCLRKISAAQREGLDLRSWQVAFCGAEPVRWETMRRFRAFFAVCGLPVHAIYPCYGLAEATLFVAGPEPRRDLLTVTVDPEPLTRGQVVLQHQPGLPSRTYVSCGRSWDGQQLTILPTSTIRNECQGDIVYSGEICISGSSISSGYWGDIAPAGPLLRTGDLGFIHLGALYITGRLKDTLVVNGRNFCAEDIEHALQGCHPEARPNGICAFNDHNEQPVIVCETRLAGARQEELAYALREGLARYCDLVPSCVFFVKPGWLPRTATGKLQRSLALQRYLDVRRHSEESTPGNFAGQSHKDPAGFRSRQNLSELLKTRIAHELGVEASTLDYARTFDELGLSSVSRLALAAVLAEDLGRELPPDLTWVYPTLEDLVAALLPAPGPIPLSEESIHQRTIQELHFGSMPPLIVVQDLLGGPSWFRPALSCWPGPAAVWGLRQITEQEDFQAPESLSDLAAQYCGSLMERRLTSYRLVGYSHCCRLALELARQLTQRGATVDFLGLVDGFPGHWLDVPPKELGTLLKREAIKIMEFLLRGQKGEAWRSLTGSVTWLKRFFLHKAGYVDRGDRWKAGLPFPKSLNVELCEKHIPQPFSGKITFFRRSFGGICVQFTPDGGWAGLAKGGVETVEVGGNHDTMMKHPHVHILVDRLARECP
jgi:thioesterase domain-containing protein/acyl carrier protein